jgi:hypothetical protein
MKLRTQLILAFSIVASVPLVGGAIGVTARRAAEGALLEVIGPLAKTPEVETRVQAIVAAGQNWELTLIIGTLFGIGVGVAFGIWTSVGVTRHIRGLAERMWAGATEVASAAGMVAESSQGVADTSGHQTQALGDTRHALERVTDAIRDNARHADDARRLSHGGRTAADSSAAEVARMQQAMQAITEANAKIAEIVRSIDDIAFQTNILALNAAVEAARAGAAGAGFSVVADEVRRLAQHSAEAAQQTTARIEEATRRSRDGAQVADQVGRTLRQVIDTTREVDALIENIAQGSNQQAGALDDALAHMAEVDALTRDNTAHAEATAVAAQELDAQTHELKRALAVLLDRGAEGDLEAVDDGDEPPHAAASHRSRGRTHGRDRGHEDAQAWPSEPTPEPHTDEHYDDFGVPAEKRVHLPKTPTVH